MTSELILRIERMNGIIVPFAMLWQEYLKDTKREKFEDFWQWAYQRQDKIIPALQAAHKELIDEGFITWHPPQIITENFTPEIERELATFVLSLQECDACHRKMMFENMAMFPTGLYLTQKAQMRRAGIALQHNRKKHLGTEMSDKLLCEDCWKKGEGGFTCGLCRERRKSNQYQAWGSKFDKPLCNICFKTKTASEWAEAVNNDEDAQDVRYSY